MNGLLPSGTVTFLFTDIEGSTRLLHDLGPTAYAEALAEHRRLLRAAFADGGGVEVDTQGDAFFVAFPTAPGAAVAANAGQTALAKGPIRVRMGLHTGTPELADDGYVGDDVHRGARIAALAHGGQILCSGTTAALLDGEQLLDLGLHRLKDFQAPVRLHQVGEGMFPPLRTPGSVDLPTPATRFLGRERELLDAVSTWLERDPPVLTIVGPGGTGKTRFAIELARLLAEEADGGTVFVPLAPLRDASLVLPTLAERLGAARFDPSAIAARIGEGRAHVVLDNLEQLLPDVAQPLAELIAAAPSLRLLVTSREPVRIAGETELELPPLEETDGIALFLERARAVRPDLADSPSVHELVRRLDGLPLALELAAARVKLLPPEQLLERLEQRLDLLKGGRDADARQATLRATVAWSFDLLDDNEQQTFARLSVFRGGFTPDTAETVCDTDLDTLASLLDKSLLRRRTDPGGGERLWMLETIREFSRERLHAEPEVEERVQRRHAEHVLELTRSAHLSSEDQGRSEARYERVLSEREDIRAALDWAIHHDPVLGAEIVVALETFWVTSGLPEARNRVEPFLALDESLPRALVARLLRLRGGLLLLEDDQDLGEACYRESLARFRELGDHDNVVALLARFAVHAGWGKDPDEARRLVAEVRALNETVKNPVVEPQMLLTLGNLAQREGDLRAALELYRSAVAEALEVGFSMWALWTLDAQLEVEIELDLLDEAERTGRRGLELAERLGDVRLERALLAGLALIALRTGSMEKAGTLWAVVSAVEQEAPILSAFNTFAAFTEPLASCRDDDFSAGVEIGALLTMEDAVELALGESPIPS